MPQDLLADDLDCSDQRTKKGAFPQAQRTLPGAVHDARDQGHSWTEIGQLLNLAPATAAHRYRKHT